MSGRSGNMWNFVAAPRRLKSRRAVPAALLGALLALVLAAPASAGIIQVAPSVSGSGTLAGNGACTGAQRNLVITPCGVFVGFELMILTAIPPAAPAGHWAFTRWEGCPLPTPTQCVVSA